jgi:hypothetical protein
MYSTLSCLISAFQLWKFLLIFYTTVKKKIQNLVFPSGFFINPGARQYLTSEDGPYPEVVITDKIYGTRTNRGVLKKEIFD